VRRHQPGDDVRFLLASGGTRKTVSVTTRPAPDDPSVPLVGIDVRTRFIYPFRVHIQLNDVGGPSAGLMFALGIVDKLTPTDLTGGTVIAGTGTIDDSGNVGPIGGIQMKIRGAVRDGARVFLVPESNCGEATTDPPPQLRLVKVSSLHGALQALSALRTGGGAVPACP
jgi:PDZ domain-containing protein